MSTPIYTEDELEEAREQARREAVGELEAKIALAAKGPNEQPPAETPPNPPPPAHAAPGVDYGLLAAHQSRTRSTVNEVVSAFKETFSQDLDPAYVSELEVMIGGYDPTELAQMLDNAQSKSAVVSQIVGVLFARAKSEGKAHTPKEIVRETEAPTKARSGVGAPVDDSARADARAAAGVLGRAPETEDEMRIGALVRSIKKGGSR